MHLTSMYRGFARVLAVGCLVGLCAPSVADEGDDLAQAIRLFEEGKYLAAQEVLLDLPPEELSRAERAQRDEYLDRVQVALSMVEKASNDLDDAQAAIEGGDLDRAEQLLRGILRNEYAQESLRRTAAAELRRLADLREQAGGDQPAASDEEADETDTAAAVEEPAEEADEATPEAAEVPVELPAEVPPATESTSLEMIEVDSAALEAAAPAPEPYEEPGADSLINRIRAEELIKWQRVVSQYREAERTVREFVIDDRYAEARQALLQARQIVEAGRQHADPLTKYESLKSEVNALAAYVEDEERRYNEAEVGRQRAEVQEERESRLRKIRDTQQRQIDLLMEQAFQLRKDKNYGAAIDTVEQVIALDPNNDQARLMRDLLEDLHVYTQQRFHRNRISREQRGVLSDVERDKIPWHDEVPLYPDDWLEIISSPERSIGGGERMSEQDMAIRAQLGRPVAINYDEATFEEVIDDLSERQNVNITVLWTDLELFGIDYDSEVTLKLTSEITFESALEQILEIVGGSEAELAYVVSDGIIKIASKDFLDRDVFTEVYDIRDLLMVIPDFTDAPEVSMTEQGTGGGGGGGGGGDTPPIFSDDDSGDEGEEEQARQDRIDALLELIRETIEPESWRAFDPAASASVFELSGQLVVTQTSSAHEEVGDLLSKLRENQVIQVAVESRFITVQSNYLEELGIDLDIVLNNGNAGLDFIPTGSTGLAIDPVMGTRLLMPRSFTRLGFLPGNPGIGATLTPNAPGPGGQVGQGQFLQPYGQAGLVPLHGQSQGGTPVPFVSNILPITDPAGINSDLPGTFAGNQTLQPALNVFGSFLDNIQVDFLIRATQADARTTILTAPRIVLFNGQRSWVAVVNQQSFVSQLQPVVAAGAAAQAPQTGVIYSGAVLDVRAVVSADRRYVTMTIFPGVGRLLDIQTFLFTTGPTVGAGASGFIQLPSMSRQVLRTTVSVPDGGTLLIGGQKLAGEVEIEAGVPILSKIPILKRLYSSRTLVKDEQVLLILVKPKILIQQEIERQAFPTLGQR